MPGASQPVGPLLIGHDEEKVRAVGHLAGIPEWRCYGIYRLDYGTSEDLTTSANATLL